MPNTDETPENTAARRPILEDQRNTAADKYWDEVNRLRVTLQADLFGYDFPAFELLKERYREDERS